MVDSFIRHGAPELVKQLTRKGTKAVAKNWNTPASLKPLLQTLNPETVEALAKSATTVDGELLPQTINQIADEAIVNPDNARRGLGFFQDGVQNKDWGNYGAWQGDLERNVNLRDKRTQIEGPVPPKDPIPAKAYNLSEGVEDFMGDTDLITARAWENPGGELDQALEDMLTVKKKTTITTPEGKKVTLNKGDMMTPDMLTGSKKDYYNSLIATGFKTAPDDELVYGFGGQELSKMAGLEGKDPGFSPQLHKGKSFHHKSMKEIQSAIHKRARALRESGEATTDDLINLHALSNSMGAPSGSRKSAGMWLEEFGHNITHKQTAQRKGIEPTTTRWTNNPLKKGKSGRPSKPPEFSKELFNEAVNASDELGVDLTRFDLQYIKAWSDVAEGQQGPINLKRGIAKWKVFRKTDAYKRFGPDGESEMSRLMKSTENMNIAELTKFQKEILEDVTKPMTEEMVLMEEVMDSLTPRELIQLMQKKDWNTALNLKKALEEKQSALAGAKEDKALRKQMNTAFN